MPFLTQPMKLIAIGAVTALMSTSAAIAAPALTSKPVADSKASIYVKLADANEKSRRSQDRSNSRDRSRDSRDRSRNRNARRHSNRNHRSDYRNRDYRSDYRRNNRRLNRRIHHYNSRHYSTPYRYTSPRRVRHVNYSPYRSSLGISFNFGTPRYSGYRWAPAAYSFYQPSYGSYASYQTQTHCRRVTREAWHHGHRELISVKECSNPYSGTYIVQGSERVIACHH